MIDDTDEMTREDQNAVFRLMFPAYALLTSAAFFYAYRITGLRFAVAVGGIGIVACIVAESASRLIHPYIW